MLHRSKHRFMRNMNFMLHCNIKSILRSNLRRAARQAIEIVYPPSCMVCHAATRQSGTLCAACWARMPSSSGPIAAAAGHAVRAQDLGAGLISPQAMAEPPVYGRARAVVRFADGPERHLVHRLKYGDRVELARPIGRWMARAGAELLTDADLLVPIPMHRRRLFARRFNQAALLAASVAETSGRPWDPLALARVKPTPAAGGAEPRPARRQRAGRLPVPRRRG